MNKPLIAAGVSAGIGFLFGYPLPFVLFMGFMGYISTNIPFDEVFSKMYMFFDKIVPSGANFCVVIATIIIFILVPDIFDWPVFIAYLVMKYIN